MEERENIPNDMKHKRLPDHWILREVKRVGKLNKSEQSSHYLSLSYSTTYENKGRRLTHEGVNLLV